MDNDEEEREWKNKAPFRGTDEQAPYSIPSVRSLNNNSMDREICARGAVGSLRRFEGEEEEWRGGERDRDGFAEEMREGRRGAERRDG